VSNDELEMTWKEAAMPCYIILSGGTEKPTRKLSRVSYSSSRISNSGPPEYETEVLTTQVRCSIKDC
jgi:hypothetical protein